MRQVQQNRNAERREGRCHGWSSQGVQVVMAWFVPPVVVPLLVFIIVAIVLVVRLFA
jgi:hypothetical protein